MSQEEKDELRERRVAAARAILRTDRTISVGVLARRIAMATQHGISKDTAHDIMIELQGRKQRSRTAEAAEAAAREAMEAKEATSQ